MKVLAMQKQLTISEAAFGILLHDLFRIRAGIDVAKGPDSWGWYIVFGHNWNR
jgi:hypothetical protein